MFNSLKPIRVICSFLVLRMEGSFPELALLFGDGILISKSLFQFKLEVLFSEFQTLFAELKLRNESFVSKIKVFFSRSNLCSWLVKTIHFWQFFSKFLLQLKFEHSFQELKLCFQNGSFDSEKKSLILEMLLGIDVCRRI